MSKKLLAELHDFCRSQKALLKRWRSHCGGSRDLELLLDFPKRSRFEMNGTQWEAVKHGIGVMFCGDGVVVDVPHAVARPDVFESDRFFDYLRSKNLNDLVGESSDQRERLAEVLREWSDRGLIERQPDERGCAGYCIVRTEVGSD